MQYAALGRTGLKVSRLGFGGMRFPMTGSKVDRDKTIPMIHRAFELGVNYIDSAVGYCGGDSQKVIGEALKGWRDKIVVSTKNPHYNKRDDRPWWKNLEDSLARLEEDCIDVYYFHSMNGGSFDEHVAGRDGQLTWMRKAQDQGMVRHVGFSFHGKPEDLKRIAETKEFDAVTLQYNLLDRSNEGVLPACKANGMAVVVMGPVGGGRLGMPSEAIRTMVRGARSVPEVALRFVLSNPNVTLALSGMDEVKQVEENVRVAGRRTALSAAEKRGVQAALKRFQKLADLYCTGCNYCMPCPAGVDIPDNFKLQNYVRVYDLPEVARHRYEHLAGKASLCLACGRCMKKCPQNIDIITQLRETVRTLDDAYGKLVVTVRPRKVERLARRNGGFDLDLQCRMDCRNLSDRDVEAALTFGSVGGVSAELVRKPPRLGPFASTSGALAVSAKGLKDGQDLPLRAAMRGEMELIFDQNPLQVALAPKASRAVASALKKAPAVRADHVSERHAKPSPAHRKASGLTARFAHDDEALIVEFQARGAFGAKAGKSSGRYKPGMIWLAVSSRVPATSSTMHHDGCYVTFDASGDVKKDVPVHVHAGRRHGSAEGVRGKLSGGSKQRTLLAKIPWKVLGLGAPKAQKACSVDVGLVCDGGSKGPWQLRWGASRSVKPNLILLP